MLKLSKVLLVSGVLGGLSGCASLHHVQVGDIDNRQKSQILVPFDIKVSQTGVNSQQIGDWAERVPGGEDVATAALILSLLQMGPQTGAPVYDARYAEKILHAVYEKCPSGRVSGLMSIRETRDYSVITGEIVKVTGFCAMGNASAFPEAALNKSTKTESGVL